MEATTRQRKSDQGLNEKDIKRLIHLLDTLERGIELLYYLLDNNRQKAFVVSLLSADSIDLEAKIRYVKRDTDVLFCVDSSENLYALLSQGTEVDGGYYFMKRIVDTVKEEGATNIYCSEIEISNTHHPIQEIIFRLLNMYQRAKAKKADGEISFHTLK